MKARHVFFLLMTGFFLFSGMASYAQDTGWDRSGHTPTSKSLQSGHPGPELSSTYLAASRGGGGFKSIRSFKLSNRSASTPATTGTGNGVTMFTPGFLPFTFLPFPVFGGSGDSILTLVILGVVIFWVVSFFRGRSRNRARGGESQDEADELDVLYGQCRKNLDLITEAYLRGQESLEVLNGKIPTSEWRNFSEDYGRINLAVLESELKDIKAKMDSGRLAAAKPLLYSFDEDAQKIYELLEELNELAKTHLSA